MRILWIYFFFFFGGGGGASQNWTVYRGSFLCILGSFLKVNVQNGGYFWVAKISFFFFFFFFGGGGGVLEIPDIFWGGR